MNKKLNDIEIIEDKSFIGMFKDKRVLAIIGGVIVVTIIICILIFVFGSNKSALNKELEQIGRNFYENYYYDQAGNTDSEKKAFLTSFVSAGIKVDLENLARASENKEEIINKFVNDKTGEKCNGNNTKVIIYPKDPFGQKDYTIDVTLDCGFDK